MKNKPVHPQELIEKRHELKMKIVVYWPLYFVVLPTIVYIVFYTPPTVERLLFGKETVTVSQLRKQIETFQAETQKQKKQIETQNKLIAQLKQRNTTETVGTGAFHGKLPVISRRFIPWQAYHTQKPNARFEDFRRDQVEYLQSQLDEAHAFISSLR